MKESIGGIGIAAIGGAIAISTSALKIILTQNQKGCIWREMTLCIICICLFFLVT